MLDQQKIAIFSGQSIRRYWDKTLEKWYFSVIDVVQVLTGSTVPKRYWSDLKIKLKKEGCEVYDKIVRLKILAEDGKKRETDMADTEIMFRLIQSIPSPKAEPFKLWLARVGYERIQEIEDPELATKRTRELYKLKGYPDDWIEKRIRGIAIREELTDEWRQRDVREDKEFAILTSEISKATFGMTPSEYKKFKNLNRENLRDHMNDLELIFTMLGEASTTKIAKSKNAHGFAANQIAAQKGGKIAGDARRKLELESGNKISTQQNYLVDKTKKLNKKSSKKRL